MRIYVIPANYKINLISPNYFIYSNYQFHLPMKGRLFGPDLLKTKRKGRFDLLSGMRLLESLAAFLFGNDRKIIGFVWVCPEF